MERVGSMLQVLISTMHLNDPIELLKKMKIDSDAIIINQCDYESSESIVYNNHKISIYSTTERGLSKSRNYALRMATAKYVIFADDDFEYSDDYQKVVESCYNKYSDADIIVFGAIRNDDYIYKIFKNGLLSSKNKYNVNSIRMTACRENIIKKNIYFDERFGTGTEISCGEDTIFISDCFKAKCKIYSNDFILCRGIKNNRESSWFHGYNAKFFKDRGLVYKRISKISLLLCLYFLVRKHKLYKNDISFIKALKNMIGTKKR